MGPGKESPGFLFFENKKNPSREFFISRGVL